MRKCLEKLGQLISGELCTHPLLPKTEEFIVTVVHRRIRTFINTGYIEKVIN